MAEELNGSLFFRYFKYIVISSQFSVKVGASGALYYFHK